ncbi:ribonuclease D [Terrihabitans rhizophilus]|uniref:Ribonuclease D n=1 Tax=Terrihabitans rhizophilus TaxID=3092662 RepID=A0ABU4RKB0_9HYPH|nr:ribonuclease D [Terrihabitans sp. PJ23]MDX6805279.1 ribonuclease D [Terrihabitans sp. PJ23]
MMITTTADLAAACRRLSNSAFVTVDTEFLRESTFWPKLCVVQLADDHEAVAVDALAPDIDLSPLFHLMADERVLKVFHAGRQDIEIIWHLAEMIPHPVFDTQVAAMVLGYGESVSYDQLVQRVSNVMLDKSSRFTDWSRRPLSEAQITYALADVTYLRDVYRHLAEGLEKRGRADWVSEEMAVLTSPDTYRQAPEDAWKRIKVRLRKPRDLAVLMEIAAWREAEAQSRDVPRSRIVKDEILGEIALRAPTTVEALGGLRGVPNGFERSRSGTDVLAAVKRGLERETATIPKIERDRPAQNGTGATVELLRVLLKMVSEKEGVAPKILATTDDLERIAGEDAPDVPALAGWRRELFGEKALGLKRGEIALGLKRGRVAALPTAG